MSICVYLLIRMYVCTHISGCMDAYIRTDMRACGIIAGKGVPVRQGKLMCWRAWKSLHIICVLLATMFAPSKKRGPRAIMIRHASARLFCYICCGVCISSFVGFVLVIASAFAFGLVWFYLHSWLHLWYFWVFLQWCLHHYLGRF